MLTDDNKLYLSYIKHDNTKNIETMILNDKFNVDDLIKLDEKIMVVSYDNRIEITDIKNNSKATIYESNIKYLMEQNIMISM